MMVVLSLCSPVPGLTPMLRSTQLLKLIAKSVKHKKYIMTFLDLRSHQLELTAQGPVKSAGI